MLVAGVAASTPGTQVHPQNAAPVRFWQRHLQEPSPRPCLPKGNRSAKTLASGNRYPSACLAGSIAVPNTPPLQVLIAFGGHRRSPARAFGGQNRSCRSCQPTASAVAVVAWAMAQARVRAVAQARAVPMTLQQRLAPRRKSLWASNRPHLVPQRWRCSARGIVQSGVRERARWLTCKWK